MQQGGGADDAGDEDGRALAASFAAETARRATTEGGSGGGTGIREIVLNERGEPIAIPRRPAPPPSFSVKEEAADLVRTPGFLFGGLLTAGAALLLVAIASADSAASG